MPLTSHAQAVLRAGAVRVVVDCDPPVHIYGLPCDMDAIAAIAERHSLSIVQDAAEAHGLTYKGRPCGSFGNLATFSFYSNKLVTTGEGGLVLTDDDSLAARLRAGRNLCFQPERRFIHANLGCNMRISNIQAAIGCAHVERLSTMVVRKREIGERYQRLLSHVPGI